MIATREMAKHVSNNVRQVYGRNEAEEFVQSSEPGNMLRPSLSAGRRQNCLNNLGPEEIPTNIRSFEAPSN